MFFGFSWLIPRERRDCFPAKPMRLVFLWEAKAGGRAEWSCGKGSALRSPSHRAAMGDAACCDGRCTAVRHLPQDTVMWRGVWHAGLCRAVFKPLLAICKQNRDALAGCIPIHFIFPASALEACLWAVGVDSLRSCLSCGSRLRAVYFRYSAQSVRRISPLRMKVSCMPNAAESTW